MIQVGVAVTKALQRLAEILRRSSDLEKVFEDEIVEILREAEKQHFLYAGADNGDLWAPLRPATILKKTADGTIGLGPLRSTDQMFDSLTQETSYSIVEKEVHKLVFGTSDPKAPFHVHGTSRMEARNPLLDPMPEEVEEQIADAVKRHLTGIS